MYLLNKSEPSFLLEMVLSIISIITVRAILVSQGMKVLSSAPYLWKS